MRSAAATVFATLLKSSSGVYIDLPSSSFCRYLFSRTFNEFGVRPIDETEPFITIPSGLIYSA